MNENIDGTNQEKQSALLRAAHGYKIARDRLTTAPPTRQGGALTSPITGRSRSNLCQAAAGRAGRGI
jgi:hypothetical protein